MSVNPLTDSMQHAELFGKPVLFTNWLIQRDAVPLGLYCYDLQGTQKNPSAKTILVDQADFFHAGTVLSPVPLKRESTVSRRVNNTFCLLGEEMTLEQFCEEHDLDCSKFYPMPMLRPASQDEAGLFYSNNEMDETLGTVGHLRMDFGHGGIEFWHTWRSHNEDRFNTSEFRKIVNQFVDGLRRDGWPLKNLRNMKEFCRNHGGAITQDSKSCGYIAEVGNYRFCLRCTPVMGDYQGYLYCYDLHQQQMHQQNHLAGRITYADGEEQVFADPQEYLDIIREELPYHSTTGFHFETLTEDPAVKKAVDDILLDFFGEENPKQECNYGLTEEGKKALAGAADPTRPHTYAWYVMTDCNTPDEQLHLDLALEEAIQTYQDSDRPEKRIGVSKDSIAAVDIVHMANGEQRFFEDYRRLDSFREDPVIMEAVEQLHEKLEQAAPSQGITMGGSV